MKSRKFLAIIVALAVTFTMTFAMTGTAFAGGTAEGGDGGPTIYAYKADGTPVNVVKSPKAVKGITYSKKTNTLTLNNYKSSSELYIYGMGSDFKVNIKGTCSLWNFDIDDSVSFTGSGKLTINKEKTSQGLQIYKSYTKGKTPNVKVTIGKNLTFTCYACKWETDNMHPISIVTYNGSNPLTAKKAIVTSGKRTSKNSFKKDTSYSPETVILNIDGNEGEICKVVTAPDGTEYAVQNYNSEGAPVAYMFSENLGIKLFKFEKLSAEQPYSDSLCYDVSDADGMACDSVPDDYVENEVVSMTTTYVTGSVFKSVPKK